MNHIKREVWAGIGVIALGLVLCLCGNSFSTQWRSLVDGNWSGTSNSASGLFWRSIGNMALLIGLILWAHAAWIWIGVKEQEAVKARTP